MAEIWRVSIYELNVTIVKSYFENILIENIQKKILIAEGKQISSLEDDFPKRYIFNVEILF